MPKKSSLCGLCVLLWLFFSVQITAYQKNDQAWIEQKNGAVVRRMVGYGRLEGIETATELPAIAVIMRLARALDRVAAQLGLDDGAAQG